MTIEGPLGASILLLLLGAVLLALANIRRGRKEGEGMTGFSTLMLIFVVGWLSAEILMAVSQQPVKHVFHFAHLVILVIFAVVLTLRWRWAVREAVRLLTAGERPAK